MSLVLRRLTPTDEAVFKRAWQKWPVDTLAYYYKPELSFAENLKIIDDHWKGIDLKPGIVPDSTYFGFVEGELVGRLNIRHTLNEFLRTIGGHIGYAVIEEYRRKGYAKEMLKQAIPLARELGIEKALLTCDDDNVGSIKTIEACGGVWEKTEVVEHKGVRGPKRFYWIKT